MVNSSDRRHSRPSVEGEAERLGWIVGQHLVDAGGIIAPIASKKITGAEVALVAFIVQEIKTMAYGVLSAVAGGLIFGGK